MAISAGSLTGSSSSRGTRGRNGRIGFARNVDVILRRSGDADQFGESDPTVAEVVEIEVHPLKIFVADFDQNDWAASADGFARADQDFGLVAFDVYLYEGASGESEFVQRLYLHVYAFERV
jgi:hypothetical protein